MLSTPGWTNFVPPPNWNKNVTELDPEDPNNNGYENEDLIVWMRTAALPTFRKLYRRVNHTIPSFSDGLPSGSYKIEITYSNDFLTIKTFVSCYFNALTICAHTYCLI